MQNYSLIFNLPIYFNKNLLYFVIITVCITFAFSMKIVIDDKIPYIRNVISRITDDAADVKDADALVVRTRTRCDRSLLEGSRVKFIATATIGYDHLDTDYLEEAGIRWVNCPGCNAGSVAQYIHSVLILLQRHKGLVPDNSTLAVVGCGHVGIKIKEVAEKMGFHVIVNDPPLQDEGKSQMDFASLEEVARRSDVITFHVPLIKSGKYKTVHLADYDFFRKLCRQPFIINTSRGQVVDNHELLDALSNGRIRDAVVDTWEDEPHINRTLLSKVYIGTPHIAGYSADGKVNADNMVIDALCDFFHIENTYHIVPPELPYNYQFIGDADDYSLGLYNPLLDSNRLKSNPESFEELRGNYPLRREFFKLNKRKQSY